MLKILNFRILLLCAILALSRSGSFAQSTQVIFRTDLGDIIVELDDNTPKHKEMFLDALTKGVYTNALFNRVIPGFVNQGGELDEPILAEEASGKRKRERLAPEILPENIHKKGALGAGRDDNPEKSSYLTQVYFSVGKIYTRQELDDFEVKSGKKLTDHQREVYTTVGGIPRLDGDYTVFGKVVSGMDVMDRINAVKTDDHDRPIEDLHFSVIVNSGK